MCGICGIVGGSKNISVSPPLIGAMCDVMTHRGPDEEGVFVDENVGLGMRRLKIIDLSSGSQPIFNEDKSIVVVFNGEIYNYLELKADLQAKGHRFYTNTDTEVLVHLYEEEGDKFLTFLNGMFALALWDKKNQRLLLARDRLGEKPLYYVQVNNVLIFGSELKSILCYSKLSKELELEAIYHYFTFNYIPAPLTIYKNIFKLLPGEYLTYYNNQIEKKIYWDCRFNGEEKVPEEELQERLYDALYEAVKLRMISDVPLGAFLSGGVDSSIMVALMSQISSTPIKTFSIGLEHEKNELPYARSVAERYGTDHHELIAKPNALDLIEQILWHFDEPFGDSSAIPTFLVSQLTKESVTVAISGDGGDELFGGYERYERILNRNVRGGIAHSLIKSASKMIGDALPFGFRGKASLQAQQYGNYDLFAVGTTEELKKALFLDNFLSQLNTVTSTKISKRYFLENKSLLNQCMFFDIKSYLPDDILTKVDRMSMANSLETRAPFLDHNLVELALKIPPDMKINNGTKKFILKKTFAKHLPEGVFTHKKTGFSIPLGEWFKKDLNSLVLETLSRERIERSGVLSYPFIKMIINQHMRGQRSHKRLIWMILAFQLWYETWFTKTNHRISEALRNRGVSQ